MITQKQEIKSLIIREGKTIKETARYLGIQPTGLNNILVRESLRYKMAKKLAQYLGYELKFVKLRDG